MFTKIKNPILFQGNLDKNNYFEGWYYKHVTNDQRTSLSFIPGISLNEKDPHSFIQYILIQEQADGHKTTNTGYVRFTIADFKVESDPFTVQIGNSIFTKDSITINFKDDFFHFQGIIHLGPFHPIETNFISPNIMGPFAYIPGMQCYHGVISMQHELTGSLSINNQLIDFSKGSGYIEKDWGNAFPKEYIWLHSNHFTHPSTSLFFSVAHIPFYFTEFEGFIANLVYKNKEYRFASYNQSTCEVKEMNKHTITIHLENKQALLKLKATVSDQGKLIAPVQDGKMDKKIKEGISGEIYLILEDKETGQIYEDIGKNAGVEIVDYS